MSHAKFLVSTVCVLLFSTHSTLAGAPDVPGAGGRQISLEVRIIKDWGVAPGQILKNLAKGAPDTSLGKAIQGFNEEYGGTPNSANDNGSGND